MRAEFLVWGAVVVLWGFAGLFAYGWMSWWGLGRLERENRVKIRRLIADVEMPQRKHVELKTGIVWSCPDCTYTTETLDGSEHPCQGKSDEYWRAHRRARAHGGGGSFGRGKW